VVVKSIPANVLAGGNPCRVIREIKPEDDDKYRKGFKEF
jgi:galactoside O-acetyltransferase